ncbi:MAG TPA: hypothetical protein PLV92_00570, partial [Pirellulaceae bacterium]|nr:hypothetical protein [Pirellulaceae bacterium]
QIHETRFLSQRRRNEGAQIDAQRDQAFAKLLAPRRIAQRDRARLRPSPLDFHLPQPLVLSRNSPLLSLGDLQLVA